MWYNDDKEKHSTARDWEKYTKFSKSTFGSLIASVSLMLYVIGYKLIQRGEK